MAQRMTHAEELRFIVGEFCNLYQCFEVAPELKAIVDLGFVHGMNGTMGGVAELIKPLLNITGEQQLLDLYFDAFDIGYELRCIDGLAQG